MNKKYRPQKATEKIEDHGDGISLRSSISSEVLCGLKKVKSE